MVFKKCPGQDLSRKKIQDVVSEIICPFCFFSIEFFFDDSSRLCPNCGKRVDKSEEKLQMDFGCAVWCDAAEQCMSPEAYSKIKRGRARKE